MKVMCIIVNTYIPTIEELMAVLKEYPLSSYIKFENMVIVTDDEEIPARPILLY